MGNYATTKGLHTLLMNAMVDCIATKGLRTLLTMNLANARMKSL